MQQRALVLRQRRQPHPRASHAFLAVTLALCLFAPVTVTRAQANMAAVTITKSFVNSQGQPTSPPNGSLAGVTFGFSTAVGAQPAAVLTTSASGQASSSVPAGTYFFQESGPAPGTSFLTASISQEGGQSQTLSSGGSVVLSAGGTYSITVTNLVSGQAGSGAATLTISLTLMTGNGQPAVGSLAGYSFTLSGQNGLPAQTQATNQLGQTTFGGLAPGIYSIAESPSSEASFSGMTINGLSAQQQQAFQIQAGGNYAVNVTNLVNGSGNVSIQKQLVDQNGQPVAGAALGGFSFTLTGQGAGAAPGTTVVSSSTGLATANVPPGAYSISEAPAAGSVLVGFTINGVQSPAGQFTVGVGQTSAITVTNRVSALANAAGGTRVVPLLNGCNNIASTFPDGTAPAVLVSGASPPSNVASIWRFDNASQTFHSAYFAQTPGAGAQPPVDISALNHLDALFICMSAPATLTEPAT